MSRANSTGAIVKRRNFMTALLGGVATAGAALARSTPTHAQQTPKMPIVGFLHPGFSDAGSPVFDALGQGLRDVGYVEGENVKIEARWARGNPDALPQLTRELIQLHTDVLVATARPSIEAARAATSESIRLTSAYTDFACPQALRRLIEPIVANDLESDPVASGYVASLAHPGGNLTGLFLDALTLCGKWLQQLSDIVPAVKKIAVLWDSTTGTYQLEAIRAGATTASIDLVVMEFRDNADLDTALESGLKQGPQAVIQLGSPLIRQAGTRTAEILSARRMPGISQFRTFPDGGGLMSYGPDLINLYRRLGPILGKILRGAHPADLPIERPTKFELVARHRRRRDRPVTALPLQPFHRGRE
jgi:putative tryptophan/tyrosine transport system substrate-binding protein